MTRRGLFAALLATLVIAACAGIATEAPPPMAPEPVTVTDDSPPVGRDAIETLTFEPLRFDPPSAERFELANGVTVFLLEDHALPLVSVNASFRGGYTHFPRSEFAAAGAVGALLRTGGTASHSPDEVDELVEDYALNIGFGAGNRRSSASVGTLRRHLDTALELWADMLRNPRFDSERVEVWRGQRLEGVRRRPDDPASLAFDHFSRLLYGDHPAGWSLEPEDLTPAALAGERLREVHAAIFCPENAIIGVTGAVGREEITERLESALAGWAPCPQPLEDPPPPDIRDEGGVFVIHRELEQSTVVMGHAGGVTQQDGDTYFATQIADWILGGGGFSSRLLAIVRGERGLAYAASSFWSAGVERQGLFGAYTQTRPEMTIAAARLAREIIEGLLAAPPEPDEVRLAVDQTVNGFVFGFEEPAQVVARQVALEAEGLPTDWFDRYLAGIQRVQPTDVHDVMRRLVDPERLTVLIVGDTTRFDVPAEELGPATTIPCC